MSIDIIYFLEVSVLRFIIYYYLEQFVFRRRTIWHHYLDWIGDGEGVSRLLKSEETRSVLNMLNNAE